MSLFRFLITLCLFAQAIQALESTAIPTAITREEFNNFQHMMEEKLHNLENENKNLEEKLKTLEDENKRIHGITSAKPKLSEVNERSQAAKPKDSKANTKKEQNEKEIEAKKIDSNIRSSYTYRKENRFLAYGCVNQDIQISCDGDRQINITSAFYGEYHETCGETCCVPHPTDECWENMETSKPSEWTALKFLCDNQINCVYEYRSMTFENSCTIGAVADFVEIYYSCSPGAEGEPVAFSAQPTEKRNYENNDQVLFDLPTVNAGGHYQTAASRFICPYDGIYLFSVTVLSGFIGQQIYGRIRVEGFEIGVALADETANAYSQGAVTVVAECASGQRVWVLHYYGTNGGTASLFEKAHSVFSGYILYKY